MKGKPNIQRNEENLELGMKEAAGLCEISQSSTLNFPWARIDLCYFLGACSAQHSLLSITPSAEGGILYMIQPKSLKSSLGRKEFPAESQSHQSV